MSASQGPRGYGKGPDRGAGHNADQGARSDGIDCPDLRTDSPAPKRRRLRATRVCGRCRRLKLGCDRALPCAACTRAGLPDGCAYAALGGLDARAVAEKNGVPLGLKPFPSTPLSAPPAVSTSGTYGIGLPSSCATPGSVPASASGAAEEIRALAGLLPPVDAVRELVRSFTRFDQLLQLVPATWFAGRVDDLLPRLPEVGKDDAPLLALLAAVCLCSALSRSLLDSGEANCDRHAYEAPAHIRSLTDTLLRHCSTYGQHNVDYAHAAVVAAAAEMACPSPSSPRAWVALGTARSAALLARLHVDRVDETLWERELRRRICYHIRTAATFSAWRLGLPLHFDGWEEVPRPLVVPDGVLQALDLYDVPPPADGAAEWAYPHAKICWTEHLRAQATILSSALPLAERLARADEAIEDFELSLPPYLRGESAESLVLRISIHEALVHLYKPYFVPGEDRTDLTAAGIDPLSRGLSAAHALSDAVQKLCDLLLLQGDGGRQEALWAFATRAFTGGMAIAYADLVGRGSVHDLDVLDSAVGSMKLAASQCVTARTTNEKALAVLLGVKRLVSARRARRVERIQTWPPREPPNYKLEHYWLEDGEGEVQRAKAEGEGTGEEQGPGLVDPYTGVVITLPPGSADQSQPTPITLALFPVAPPRPDGTPRSGVPLWDQWEGLFRDFLGGTGATS